jgi:hypothetical protein
MWRFAVSDVVVLRDTPIDLDSDVGHAFVVDCCRAGEGLLTDRELAEKWELAPPNWIAITKSAELGHAIRAERERRVLTGVAAREAAAKHFAKAPSILDQIMSDASSNPRHKIEAIRELRQTAIVDNADRPRESERFIIRIDLSGDGEPHIETYDKSKKVDASDGDSPNNLIPLEGKPDADAW